MILAEMLSAYGFFKDKQRIFKYVYGIQKMVSQQEPARNPSDMRKSTIRFAPSLILYILRYYRE